MTLSPGTGNAAVAIAILALASAPARAQETAPGWPGLDVSRLSTVYVLDDAGQETEGKLLRLDPDALVILVAGVERRFESGRVRSIEKRGDSLRNGLIIGTVTGVLFGLLSAGVSDCSENSPSGPCPVARAGLFLISTGMWAAIGTGIDALIPGRTALYPVRGNASGGRSNSLSTSGRRLALSYRFHW